MCGLTGFIDYTGDSSEATLRKMTDTMLHRGPDGYGCDVIEKDQYKAGLGHRRLSILDLSELGSQPMYTQDKRYGIIFNGEVYNFRSIVSWLETKGHQLKSHSDTEAILLALIEEGPKAIDRFTGMFSIAFFDFQDEKLLLIRDRAGVKPLYYAMTGRSLLFASETRAMRAHPHFNNELNPRAISEFLEFGYIKSEGSIYDQVEEVPPGHYISFDFKTKELTKATYWNIRDYYNKPLLDISYEEASEQLEALLIDAFSLRMVSDVPVGVFLSGGVDSSTVTAMLQKHMGAQVSTFTIGFDDPKYNEAEKAKAIANYLGTDHNELYCSEKELLDIFPILPDIYDEPYADPSAIPTSLVSKFAREKVTVALSADAGDEVFGGYNKYFTILERLKAAGTGSAALKAWVWNIIYTQFSKFSGTHSRWVAKAYSELKYLKHAGQPVEMLVSAQRIFGALDMKGIVNDDLTPRAKGENFGKHRDDLSTLQAYDYQDYLVQDILVKVDRAGMHVSLEGREPLLDHRISEFAAQLPVDYKVKGGVRKRILRDINKKYLPSELIDSKKKGFSIPQKTWMQTHLKDYIMEYLGDNKIKEQGLLSPKYVGEIMNRYKKGQITNRIWNILALSMWHERWM